VAAVKPALYDALSMDAGRQQPFGSTAEWLADRYRRAGFKSDRQAGERVGVERTTLRAYVDGLKVPPDDIVIRLAEYFGDDPDEMLALAARTRRRGRRTEVSLEAGAIAQIAELITGRIADEVAERVLERLAGGGVHQEMETVLQRAGVEDSSTLDERIPVLFSGVIWEELTEAEKAGVIALAKRLMGRPQGRMGRRRRQE